MNQDDQTRPLIKFTLPQEQHDLIRLASASRRLSMAAFARATLVREATRVTREITLPDAEITSASAKDD